MLTGWNDIDRMFGAMDLLRRRMDRVSSDFDRSYRYGTGLAPEEYIPRTNLYDNGNNIEIWAEVPGLSKEDLKVKIQGNYLEISGERKSDAPEGYTAHRVERGITSFTRSFTLPSDVDSEKVGATLKNGLLILTMPKSEAAKPKQITIN
jgi:HSP20 family protein